MITLVGDIHGDINYLKSIDELPNIIVLGDLGFKQEHDWFLDHMYPLGHKVLFGNHDYYPYVDRCHSMGHYGSYKENMFFIRGASSVDKHHRIQGRDWFEDEELSYLQQKECIEWCLGEEPEIIISHECPTSMRERFEYKDKPSNTSKMMEEIFQIHQPKLWLFGHHHVNLISNINGTIFQCLAPNQTITLCNYI